MSAPTIYKWTDADAPQFHGNATISEVEAVIRGCLVDGYSAGLTRKDPPGATPWSMPFADATGFILQQGGSQPRKCALKFYSIGTNYLYCSVHAAVSWSDINTPITEWTDGDTAHRVGLGYGNNSASFNVPWFIMATQRSVYFNFGDNRLSLDSPLFNGIDVLAGKSQNTAGWFFGDYIPTLPSQTTNQVIIMNDRVSTQSNEYTSVLAKPTHTATFGGIKVVSGTSSNIDESMILCDFIINKPARSGTSLLGGIPATTAVDLVPTFTGNNLYTIPARIVGHNELLGIMPGITFPVNPHPYPHGSEILSFPSGGDTIYVFNTSNTSNYFITDGEWGVD